VEHSFSFPSGHATIAVAFYGFLAFLAMRGTKRWEKSVNICFAGIAVVLLIGFSRLYLGVHYLSDVWAGYLVGALWLIAGISMCEWLRTRRAGHMSPSVSGRARTVSLVLAFLSLGFYAGFGVHYTPLVQSPAQAQRIVVPRVRDIFSKSRLTYTETLGGEKRRPICFIIAAGNDQRFVQAIEASGWHLADDITVASFARLLKSRILGSSYPAAPVTPAFWNTEINNYAFRRSAGTHPHSKSHCARFWRTRYNTEDDDHLYVGTVSIAMGLVWGVMGETPQDTDAERELLFEDLKNAKKIVTFRKIRVENPAVITSFLQNRIRTDGFAYFVRVP
jgi:undecaprenyl-diphosphatase